MFASRVYKSSPVWAQSLMISGRAITRAALREGARFRHFRAQIEETQWLRGDALRQYQARRLDRVIRAAFRHVPFYRERYRGLPIDRMSFPADIERLPMITKDDIRAAGKSMVSARAPLVQASCSTSGTTGSPIELRQDLGAVSHEAAFVWRQLEWAGCHRGERRAWMRGETIVPPGANNGPYWRRSFTDNTLMLSSLHLSRRSAPAYLDALADFDPVLIQAYPSSVCFLAEWMQQHGIRYRGRSLRSIVASSETFDHQQRDLVARMFGCKVFDWYGLAERVAAIGMCEHGRYHMVSDYSFVEMIPTEDGMCQLVGTGFSNQTMPLIRYQCGDLVRPSALQDTCACGREFPLVDSIVGRADDSIKLPDGRRVSACLAGNTFRGVPGLIEGQIRQERMDALTVLVVPSAGFGEASRQQLLANLRARIGGSLACEVRLVQEIARSGRGKFKAVICNV